MAMSGSGRWGMPVPSGVCKAHLILVVEPSGGETKQIGVSAGGAMLIPPTRSWNEQNTADLLVARFQIERVGELSASHKGSVGSVWPETNARRSHITRPELQVQDHNDDGRPGAVKFAPRPEIIERRPKWCMRASRGLQRRLPVIDQPQA